MFKFNLDVENRDEKLGLSYSPAEEPDQSTTPTFQEPFREVSISQLLDCLPPLISYSPLSIPLSSGRSLTLARRDLFDARFQLISQSGDDFQEGELEDIKQQRCTTNASALEFIEAPSDLVPGIYEGGLKTWECSLDLVSYLDGWNGSGRSEHYRGIRILELGCGTAVPSLYILCELLSTPHSANADQKETYLHLQDYNTSVLELITFPNILLAWYFSLAGASYRETECHSPGKSNASSTLDALSPSELPITPELKSAFLSSLREQNISTRFFSGSWGTFDVSRTGGNYNLVLTSETIYRTENLHSLVSLLQAACGGSEKSLEGTPESHMSLASGHSYACLVAAKIMYFGVGGGVSEFTRVVEGQKEHNVTTRGKIQTVWEQNVGVGRKIMRVHWLSKLS